MHNKQFVRILNFLLKVTLLISFFPSIQPSLAAVPKPDHVVICILENHSYQQIVGSNYAPYINTLVFQSANLLEYYALTHPSQPNYLMLFSGSNQGETTDNLPAGTPWTTPNLGGALLNAGNTFKSYSEGLPTPGSTVAVSGAYARKHCPWVNWQGNGLNQIPSSCNLSMTEFPTNFNLLPDVSFVIPNQNNDMHNGSDPGRISAGDNWLQQYLKPYIDWAQDNNSLFILTLDEDNFTPTNRIMCLFIGPMVRQGNYYLKSYNHYDLLHTIEEMYSLPNSGNSANAESIDEIWMSTLGIQDFSEASISSYVYPNPLTDNSRIVITEETGKNGGDMHLLIYNIQGKLVSDEIIHVLQGKNSYAFRKEGFSNGVYTFQIKNERTLLSSGKVVVD